MDNYPGLFLQQLAPLVAFRGTDAPAAAAVLACLESAAVAAVWDNCILKNRLSNQKYTVAAVDAGYVDAVCAAKPPDAHSRHSPFNVDSELFPNGILQAAWLEKYAANRPFAYVAVFESDDDDALAAELAALRARLSAAGVRLVAVVLSSVDDSHERMARLRQVTGLARGSGLVVLDPHAPTLDKDVEVAVFGLLAALKAPGVAFYTAIEAKIRQRNKKYYTIPSSANVDTTVELTPKHLETRNLLKLGIISQYAHPHNLESCIKPLEAAYQNLVEILHDNFFEYDKDAISAHDVRLYGQIRTLIDMTAFHIVRAYLSLEEPVTALKKHAAHVLNVVAATRKKLDLNEWISVQYQWLGELLMLIPRSILQAGNLASKKAVKNVTGFLGGLRVHDDDAVYDIFTNPGLIFLKASSYIKDAPFKNPAQLDYIRTLKSADLISERRLQLLQKAAETTTPEDSPDLEAFSSLLGYTHFLLGEEYFKRKTDSSIHKAVEYFDSAFRRLPTGWSFIVDVICKRLMECHNFLHTPDEVIRSAVMISTLSSHNANVDDATKVDFDAVDSDTIDVGANTSALFDVQAVFCNEATLNGSASESHVHDNLVTQLFIKPVFSSEALAHHFKQDVDVQLEISTVQLVYDRLDKNGVSTGGLPNITVTHSKDAVHSAVQKVGDDSSVNLQFSDNNGKAIEIVQEVKKAGTYLLKSIELNSRITLSSGSKQLVIIDKQELHEEFLKGQAHSIYQFYYKLVDEKLLKIPLRLDGLHQKSIKVLPITPEVVVRLKSDHISNIVLGEKILMKFDIHVENHHKLNYSGMTLSPRVNVLCDDDESSTELIDTHVNWKGLKDDEALQLLDMTEPREVELGLSIRSASLHADEMIKKLAQSYRVIIDLKTTVSEVGENSDEEVGVYDTAKYVLPIINQAFDFKFSIAPKYRDSCADMPCPFVLQGDHEGSSLPIVTRLWSGNLGLVEPSEFDIRQIVFTIRSKNPEILVELLDTDDVYSQEFTTRCKNGVAHRNVTISASVEVEWCRKESMHLNQFSSLTWEISLPLSDPRVLHEIEHVDRQRKTCKLVYIIENPTPRTFTFSTRLVDDNERFVWNFEDERNTFPLSQSRFPVVPFSRFVIEYFGTYAATEPTVQLPQFKVYDVQYKVWLPTLPVVRQISATGGGLYWNSE